MLRAVEGWTCPTSDPLGTGGAGAGAGSCAWQRLAPHRLPRGSFEMNFPFVIRCLHYIGLHSSPSPASVSFKKKNRTTSLIRKINNDFNSKKKKFRTFFITLVMNEDSDAWQAVSSWDYLKHTYTHIYTKYLIYQIFRITNCLCRLTLLSHWTNRTDTWVDTSTQSCSVFWGPRARLERGAGPLRGQLAYII